MSGVSIPSWLSAIGLRVRRRYRVRESCALAAAVKNAIGNYDAQRSADSRRRRILECNGTGRVADLISVNDLAIERERGSAGELRVLRVGQRVGALRYCRRNVAGGGIVAVAGGG